MKILLIETAISGHHLPYAKALLSIEDADVYIALPHGTTHDELLNRSIELQTKARKGLISYISFIWAVQKSANNCSAEVIHVLYGDALLKFFGLGMGLLGKHYIVVTFHHFRYSFLRNLARKLVFQKIDCGVVHTKVLLDRLHRDGIRNAVHIEYPQFQKMIEGTREEARDKLGIHTTAPVLLALGGTRHDKGLDILLQALKSVAQPFFLFIAGKEEDFTEDFIAQQTASYSDCVMTLLKFLSDEEFALCLNACDIVVLPYRVSFDGASGPLGEGVAREKVIIGPDHGSLGQTIQENHLGYTFEAENVESLRVTLDKALSTNFTFDKLYKKYQEELSTERFIKKYQDLYQKVSLRNSK